MVALHTIEQKAGGYERAQMGRVDLHFNVRGIVTEIIAVM